MGLSRRQFLLTATAAAIAPALPPLPVAPVHVAFDLASGHDMTVIFYSTPSLHRSWVLGLMRDVQRDAERAGGVTSMILGLEDDRG